MYLETKRNGYGWNFINPATDLVDFQVIKKGPNKGFYLWEQNYPFGFNFDGYSSYRKLYGAAADSTFNKYKRLVLEQKTREKDAKTRKENTEY